MTVEKAETKSNTAFVLTCNLSVHLFLVREVSGKNMIILNL